MFSGYLKYLYFQVQAIVIYCILWNADSNLGWSLTSHKRCKTLKSPYLAYITVGLKQSLLANPWQRRICEQHIALHLFPSYSSHPEAAQDNSRQAYNPQCLVDPLASRDATGKCFLQ